jgi:hypothetical protein
VRLPRREHFTPDPALAEVRLGDLFDYDDSATSPSNPSGHVVLARALDCELEVSDGDLQLVNFVDSVRRADAVGDLSAIVDAALARVGAEARVIAAENYGTLVALAILPIGDGDPVVRHSPDWDDDHVALFISDVQDYVAQSPTLSALLGDYDLDDHRRRVRERARSPDAELPEKPAESTSLPPIRCRVCDAQPGSPCTDPRGRARAIHSRREKEWLGSRQKAELDEARAWSCADELDDWEGPIEKLRDALDDLLRRGFSRVKFDAGHNNVQVLVRK